MICVLHINYACWPYWNDYSSMESIKLYCLFSESVSIVAVNLYAIVTGYVCVNIPWKIDRYIRLWLQALFYTCLGLVLHEWLRHHGCMELPSLNWKAWVKDIIFVPVGRYYWYFSAYTVLFLLIPFLNPFLRACSRARLAGLLMLILFIICPLLYIADLTTVFYNGGSAPWLVVLYMVGAYLKLHPVRISQRRLLFGFAASAICTAAISVLKLQMQTNYIFLPTVVGAICLFLFFEQIKIRSRFVVLMITRLAPFAFGVYLVHLAPGVWPFFLVYVPKLFDAYGYSSYLFVLAPIVLYLACTLVDVVRSGLFSVCQAERLVAILAKLAQRVIQRVSKLAGNSRETVE